MKHLLPVIACALLAACGTTPVTQPLPPRVAVPVECKESMPARPAMPTDSLKAGATNVDQYVQAAEAEIALRDGYEGELRTALENCKKPIQ